MMSPMHVTLVVAFLAMIGASKSPMIVNKPSEDAPKVNIDQGAVIGTTGTSLMGRTFLAFKGIPYAKPPVGEFRFKPPVPVGEGNEEIDATKEGAECIQKNYLLQVPAVSGSEDCLFVNIYTPQTQGADPLPVMVYIHGGGFFTGSGTSSAHGPEHLLDKDIVLVTFNYRLGVIGFLSTGDAVAPGNYGMKDQVEALRWVQKNIGAFGGDKNLVTIFGQSAGAASVHYHMLSPMSRGLFHRAISQSASALSAWAWPSEPLPVARRQGGFVDCMQESTTDLIECIRAVDAATLVNSGDQFHEWSIDPLDTYTPVIETVVPNGEEAFLTGDPMELIRSGKFAKVPWMIGVVQEEGIIRGVPIVSDEGLLNDLNDRWSELGPTLFEIPKSVDEHLVNDMWRNVTSFYIGNDSMPLVPDDASGFINMYSDRSFVHGVHKSATLHAASDHSTVFMYQFNYKTTQPVSYQYAFAPLNPRRYGVSHCDDLLYVFHPPGIFPGWPSQPADLQVVDVLVTFWTNFAKHGDPTPTSSTNDHLSCVLHSDTVNDACDLANIKWSPIPTSLGPNDSKPTTHYLYIRNTTTPEGSTLDFTMKTHLFKERMEFWDSAPLLENSLSLSSHS